MKNMLIITSHYLPSNLTGVHRSRIFAKHLPEFDWNPIILTVHENHYEEKIDTNLCALIPEEQRIEKVSAFNVSKPRLVGDIGLRGFLQLRKRALSIIAKEKIDFIYILIPSFYLSLLGPILNRRTTIKYGIDYIDPWVHFFPGSEKKLSRHWWSTQLSKILEPYAVSRASLISGVAESYFLPVLNRNPFLKNKVKTVSIPYGWDKDDLNSINIARTDLSFHSSGGKIKIIYAGVFLPKSKDLFEVMCYAIKNDPTLFRNIEFHFIGTENKRDFEQNNSIQQIAEKYGISNSVIFEHPKRISYLEILSNILEADGLFVLGSTEPHYSPSKLFLSFITQKPVFAFLHHRSNAVELIVSSGLGTVCPYLSTQTIDESSDNFKKNFSEWLEKIQLNLWKSNSNFLEKYSASAMTKKLVDTLSKV
jgi:hypothetical protein